MKKSVKILIVVLCLIIVCLVGFIIIDKVTKKDKNSNINENTTNILTNDSTNNRNSINKTYENINSKQEKAETKKDYKYTFDYTYTFSGNGSAILKQTTSDSPSVWFDGRCSNCGMSSKMIKNKNASFTFSSNEKTSTYKTRDLCDKCKKWYDIEIQCTRIEK